VKVHTVHEHVTPFAGSRATCVEIKIRDAFVLNRRVDLHAIDATSARWRGDVGSSPVDGASTTACTRHTG
jgi:hypothetical protein